MSKSGIDQRVFDLYDDYCHGRMERREFLRRAAAITVIGGGTALAMAESLLPSYAEAQMVSFTDQRIKARYVEYDSKNGTSGKMRGYMVHPVGEGPFPAVIVIHENRGLNPYIEDVARRVAIEGFLALAPDGLAPAGGYPGNDDDGRKLQSALDPDELYTDLLNSAKYLKKYKLSTGKLGAVGFCYGGAVVNMLATDLGKDLDAGVPFYGRAPELKEVGKIKAPMLFQFAEKDDRVNASWADYEPVLKEKKVSYEAHIYPGTQHGFHNNSTPRYDEAAAKLAWDRTIAFFKQKLA